MKVKTVCFIMDVDFKETKSGKSTIQHIKEAIMPAVSKLEPGDCVILYEKNGIAAYDQLGHWLSAVNSYVPHAFYCATALMDIMQAIHAVDVEDEYSIFVITDKFTPEMDYGFKKDLQREMDFNVYRKTGKFHFWCVGHDLWHLRDLNNLVECRELEDIGEIVTEWINCG